MKIVARYWRSYIILKKSALHTFNGNSIDRPCDRGFRVAIRPAGEHSRFFRGQDEVLRGTDPKGSRCGNGKKEFKNQTDKI